MARMSTTGSVQETRLARAGHLPLGDGHVMAWYEQGPVDGPPVLLLHGGPGSATSRRMLDLVDIGPLRLVSFDQRGCGHSTPRGETRANTTDHLVRDIEVLRSHLHVASWLVVGGSWGATLGLAYAARHPAAVAGLLLRNLFVPSVADIAWFFQGAAARDPDAWQRFASVAPETARHDLLSWLAAAFAGGDDLVQVRAALAWWAWEQALSSAPAAPLPAGPALHALVDRYRIQAHYLAHAGWLGSEGLCSAARASAMRPVLFLHGAEDAVCRPQSARMIQDLVAGSTFESVPGAGHDPFHPAMAQALRRALDCFARSGRLADPGRTA